MTLFINAINLSSAGGLNVALNFLKGLTECRSRDLTVYVAAPRECGYEALATPSLHLVWLPDGATSWLARLFVDYVWLPSRLKTLRPDVVFTMGNLAMPTSVPQLVLLHYPHPAYPHEREVWKRLDWFDLLTVGLRNYVFGQRLKYASVLFVQTEAMRARICTVYPKIPSVQVMPNAFTQLAGQHRYDLPVRKESGLRYLVCLSRYYAHKNIEILVVVARLIRARNLPYRILLTIEPSHHRRARRLLDRIRRENLTDLLINIGTVPATGLLSLHEQIDGLVLPTLLESFSATYVDAMQLGVPVFTSRRDFAETVCGPCAFYFDPLSATSIVDTICLAFGQPALLQHTIEQGRLRSATLPDWTTIAQRSLVSFRALAHPPLIQSFQP
jgi:glycosyltransferase involved in cell wall biosynthesis